MTSPRIDATIAPASVLRTLSYAALAAVLIALAWLAPLALWQYVVLLIVAAAVSSYLALARPILLHLSQPPVSQRLDKEWQLLMRTARGDALWQAQLIKVHGYQWMMNIEFRVIEPEKRLMSVTIFRDQVTSAQWRRLNILATILSNTAT